MRLLLLPLVFIAALAEAGKLSKEENLAIQTECSRKRFARIINADSVAVNDTFSHAAVAIVVEGSNEGVCSGTLISPRHVLTATHCFEKHECTSAKPKTRIHVGALSIDEPGLTGTVVGFKNYTSFPGYYPYSCKNLAKFGLDITVVELNQDVANGTSSIACLPASAKKPKELDGYGFGLNEAAATEGQLGHLKWNAIACPKKEDDHVFCVRSVKFEQNGCFGDSGHGGLEIGAGSSPIIHGVFSNGEDCDGVSNMVRLKNQGQNITHSGFERFVSVHDYKKFICEASGTKRSKMAGTSQQMDGTISSDATPYEQVFQTEVEKKAVCDGRKYEKLKNGETVRLGEMQLGRVKFELELKRILVVTADTNRDIILNISCNRKASDPHWRIRFTATARCKIHGRNEWESAGQSMTANRKFHTMGIPIARMRIEADGVTLKIKIKETDWAGTLPPPVHLFTERSDLTDATLIVEGRHLYVSRAILALQSSFFHTLFYDTRFPDAAQNEFRLPDISFDHMVAFLTLIYPNITDRHACISSSESIEAMLALADRFKCDSVTRRMEKLLMGEKDILIFGFTLARRLLLADRYRLSAPCSLLLARLRDYDELRRLRGTDEYAELSDGILASILDMVLEEQGRSSAQRPVFLTVDEEVVDAAAAPAISAAAVSAGWNRLQRDVAALQQTMGNFALSSTRSRKLHQAIQYLLNLPSSEFDDIPTALRQALTRQMNMLICTGDRYPASRVDRFIAEVDDLRFTRSRSVLGPAVKKRKLP